MVAVSEVQIGVRMTEELLEKLDAAAKQNACGVSTFVRRYLEQAFGIERKLYIPPPQVSAPHFPIPNHSAPGRRRRRAV